MRLTDKDWENPENLMWIKLGSIHMRDEGYRTFLSEALRKLFHYEDLEEQGRLIELPCAVGDTVYLISSQYSECSKHQERFDDYNCQGCEDECDSHKEYFIYVNENISAEWIVRAMGLNRFGKTVFTTREEAEAKLKEMEGAE